MNLGHIHTCWQNTQTHRIIHLFLKFFFSFKALYAFKSSMEMHGYDASTHEVEVGISGVQDRRQLQKEGCRTPISNKTTTTTKIVFSGGG